MAQDARAVANYFLKLADADGVSVDPMKLQKLVYFAHGWYLALTDKSLITEDVQAWRYGPVIPSVYHEFKHYGRNPITGRAVDVNPKTGEAAEIVLSGSDRREIEALIHRVWKVYGRLNGISLSKMTHHPNTPWDKVWNQQHGSRFQSAGIDNAIIKEYFGQQVVRAE